MASVSRAGAAEIDGLLARLDVSFGETGYDRFGISRSALAKGFRTLEFFYRRYFRVQCHGLQHVPTAGRVMLVGNHSGGYAIDAVLLIGACFFDLDPPRLAHGMADKFIGRIPFLSQLASQTGQITGLPEHAVQLLEDERALMVFPEGVRGTSKLYRNRRSLVRFGTGFMRLALQSGTPIVPVAIIGGGEAVPTVANIKVLGRLLGVPYLPITAYGVPWPLPVSIHYHFGEPMRFDGSGTESDTAIAAQVERVRQTIQALMDEGGRSYHR